MKRLSIVFLVLCLTAAAALAQDLPAPGAAPQVDAKTATDQASYGIGRNMGGSLRSEGVEVNLDLLLLGLKDAYAGAPSKFTDAQLQAAFSEFGKIMKEKQAARAAALGTKNKREGDAFLAANSKKPGVRVLRNGLQYQVIKSGNGPTPKATDNVTTHYHGTLIDGTVFDSSVQRGQPSSFAVNGVIAGWTQALQMMKVGDKWRLFVPSELAYRERGAGEKIGPHTVLIFEIELLGIK